MDATTIALALAAFGYAMYRMVATTRFNARQLWIVPVILFFLAVGNAPGSMLLDGRLLAATMLSIALGLMVGAFRGWTTTLFRDANGVLWQKGSPATAGIYLATIPVRFGLRYLLLGGAALAVAGTGSKEAAFSYLVMALALFAGRSAAIILRHPDVLDDALAPHERHKARRAV
ncbi:MAG: hypothetical protein ACYDAG_00290 [Chloroflexota bacterium]